MQAHRPQRELILVGGGHAHIQVLRGLIMRPLPEDVHVTVIVDRPIAVYSGMVPGVISGRYPQPDVEIDVRPLARKAGARFLVAAATRIDPHNRQVHVQGQPPLSYDFASINVGSTVAGLDTPGVREHAVRTRPIARLLDEIDERLDQDLDAIAIVGGGAGGVELAFAVHARTRAARRAPRITLLSAADRLLPARAPQVGEKIVEAAQKKGIAPRMNARVVEVQEEAVRLASGERVQADLTIWVTGAAALPLLHRSDLPKDERGFVKVNADLQVRDHPELFAAGDCAVLTSWPQIPKAGVYAVRQGPVLLENLRATVENRPLSIYEPQRDFLTLLNLSDGTAIGARWGRSLRGRWLMWLKDTIDRRFMQKFQVLHTDGAPAESFKRGMPSMAEMEMVCGGCAAKVGQTPLRRALATLPPPVSADHVVMGIDEAEDVVAVKDGGRLRVENLDVFTAFTDDPRLVAETAVQNALSDLYAKGVTPQDAMAFVSVPRAAHAERTLTDVLRAARGALDAAGVTLLGGHTTVGTELMVGFHVTGYARAPLWTMSGLKPGDRLVLTKPLGTGVLWNADMTGDASSDWMETAIQWMRRSNAEASKVATGLTVSGATDVTGFGLAGHLAEMMRQSGTRARLWLDQIPALPGALVLLSQGRRSTASAENQRTLKVMNIPGALRTDPRIPLLFDPQTAGGLLLGMPEPSAVSMIQQIDGAAIVGEVIPSEGGALLDVVKMRRGDEDDNRLSG
ncbi:MAG: selenide, water dikinase SelD [Myxococcota bacterium]